MTKTANPLGVVLASSTPPEHVGSFAALAEELGFSELWIPEDYWFLGAMTCLVRALAATERIPVGIGVVAALARHPAVLAMELASAERMFPGRVRAGIGTGVPPLMEQMGAVPRSPLTALRESLEILRTLLRGDACSGPRREFELGTLRLEHPPASVPPLYTGVLAPKGLRLSGEIADGTVVSAMASAAYVRWARERIAEGAAKRTDGEDAPFRLPTYAMYCLDDDEEAARAAVRPLVALYLSMMPTSPLVAENDFGAEVAKLCERGGADAAALIGKEMPDSWLDQLTVAGNPETCAARIDALLDAGADSVVLMPLREDAETMLRRTASEVLPKIAER